jgi:hypothetical protein
MRPPSPAGTAGRGQRRHKRSDRASILADPSVPMRCCSRWGEYLLTFRTAWSLRTYQDNLGRLYPVTA